MVRPVRKSKNIVRRDFGNGRKFEPFLSQNQTEIIVLPKALAIMFENEIYYTSPIRTLINFLI
jgi:hypothetical protein